MTITDSIRDGLIARVSGDNLVFQYTAGGAAEPTSVPVSVPGVQYDGAKPYIEVTVATAVQTGGGSLAGNEAVQETGVLMATVVADELGDGGIGFLYEAADAIAALFPEGQLTQVSGANLQITGRPDIRGLLRDGTEIRLPIAVSYIANWDVG